MIQFLTDKPLDYYKKSSMLSSDRCCEQCRLKTQKVNCDECKKSYCSACFKSKHSKGMLKKHNWNVISVFEEKSSKSSAKNLISSSYVKTIASAKFESNQINNISETLSNSLLNGNYDEESNAKSFAAALNEWRQSRVSSATQKSVTLRSAAIGTRDYVADYNPLDTFIDNMKYTSSISYLDRIAIKMGMKNSISTPKSVTQTISTEKTVADEKFITPKEGSFILSFACPSQDSLSFASSQKSLMRGEFEIDIKSCDEDEEEVQNKLRETSLNNSETSLNNSEINCIVVEEVNDHCLNNIKCDDEVFLSTKISTLLWHPKPIYEGLDKYYLLGMYESSIFNQSDITGTFSNRTDTIGICDFANQIKNKTSNCSMIGEYGKKPTSLLIHDEEKFWKPELFSS